MADFDICPDWDRPCEWPDLPAVGPDEEKVVGLVAVEDTDSEFLAVLCEGDYTIDWGDGSDLESVVSGVKAEHQYVYANIPGDPICPGSSSEDYEGYKVVVVTITPKPLTYSPSSSEHPSLTKVDFQQRHSALGDYYLPSDPPLIAASTHRAKWLDIVLNVPNCTTLKIAPAIPTSTYPEFPDAEHVAMGWLQQVVLNGAALTSLSGLFAFCFGLSSAQLSNTGAVTSTSYMFYRCYSLRKIGVFDTASVTDMSHMFALCYALMCVPLLNTSSVTTMERMFTYCYVLPTIPEFDTSSVSSMQNMFNNCWCLSSVPLLDTSAVTTMYGMFDSAMCLPSVPYFNLSAVTTTARMFFSCENLRAVPNFDTSSVTSITNMFYACSGLASLPSIDLSAVSSPANASPFVSACYFLRRSRVHGLRYSHSYVTPTKPLTATALNEIFTNLGTAAGSQTITITGCLGAATCDKTIATAKGWTVTG
jgi:surface protein